MSLTNDKKLSIEPNLNRDKVPVTEYKVVDGCGNVEFWGDFSDCYLYIHPEYPITIFDRFQDDN